MKSLIQDLRYSFRSLSKSPSLSLMVILTLAIAIGANTSVFSVLYAVVLQPLDFEDADRMVMLHETDTSRPGDLGPVSYPNYEDWKNESSAIESAAAFHTSTPILIEKERSRRIRCANIDSNFFSILSARPHLGRLIGPEDLAPDAPATVVISHEFWDQHFGSSESAIGETLILDSKPRTVVGVLPESFVFPVQLAEAKLWMPMDLGASLISYRQYHFLDVLAKLSPTATIEQAQTELDTVSARIATDHPRSSGDRGCAVRDLHESLVRRAKPLFYLMTGAVALVMLIACVNVTNLLLARGIQRQREFALRAAVGAGHWHMIRLLFAEGALLAGAGAVAGVLIATWCTKALIHIIPRDCPRIADVTINTPVLAFAALAAIVTCLLISLLPALSSARFNLISSLKHGMKGITGSSRNRLQRGLLISEVALALTLLVGAGLLVRSMGRLLGTDPGFDADRLLTFDVSGMEFTSSPDLNLRSAYVKILDRLNALPGVESAAASSCMPWTGNRMGMSIKIPDRPASQNGDDDCYISFTSVSPGYFKALGIPLKAGREFEISDDADQPSVAIVNEAMARKYWPGEDPTGKTLALPGGRDGKDLPILIVGVVGDVRQAKIYYKPSPCLYTPIGQMAGTMMCYAIRTTGEPTALINTVRKEVASTVPELPAFDFRTMNQRLSEALFPRRFPMLLLTAFSLIALALSSLGLYGVLAFSVAQRRHEIGIRMTLGANKNRVLLMILRQGLVTVLIGTGVGLALSLATTRLLSNQLYEVTAVDPLTLVSVVGLLLGVALLSCYIPSRRALRVDPITALRCE